MVHNTLVNNCAPTEEKELKRISTLEQRVAELENTLLRTATVALEKRVAELETSLKVSNDECDKLRKTIVEMESAREKVIPRAKEESTFERDELTSESGDEKDSEKDSEKDGSEKDIFEEQDNSSEISDALSVSFDDKEAEIIYGRILKLVENMKSDCTKAIKLKIPVMSQLPKPGQSPKPTTTASNMPTPTYTLTPTTPVPTPTSPPSPSQSRMPGRSRAPSVSSAFTSSRPATPSNGHQGSPNLSKSPTRILAPTRVSSLPPPNVSSRPSTPSSVHSLVNSNSSFNSTGSSHGSPVIPAITNSLRRKSSSISRPRTPNWPPSCNALSGTQSPPSCNGIGIQSNLQTSFIPSSIPSIPSNIPSKSKIYKFSNSYPINA